ncbi:flagellar biosynthetic protein FliO [Parahaliea aestuarii]|uniref:Flagellar protein n=1 Tax=Parahaliea aestuarii TaxID=1852021 RepID=A0A5C9A499_9GAMM|nr:flagellar biosynthetic protein FliO [Parahaliea aestuarii]TXS94782.1 flagellar biosynthetic protein FliO [Parahaliea aestuarii]
MSAPAPAVDTALGLAALGKTAVALAVVLALIYGASALLRRIGGVRTAANGNLQVVSSVAVGQRERVVLVDVGDTRLVLGVASGQVNTLHSMPAPASDSVPATAGNSSFASRLAGALRGQDRRDAQ